VVFIDIYLSKTESGLDLLPQVKQLQPNAPAIIISGMANMDHVMEALKAGAYDMLCKPFNLVDLLNVTQRAIDKKRMADRNDQLVEALRRERDLLEQRVKEATQDLQATIGSLRLLNKQVSTMFEISQTPLIEGSFEEVMHRIFELLRRIFDFEGAFYVIYDARAHGINLTYAQGEGAEAMVANLADAFRRGGEALLDLAESQERLPTAKLQGLLWSLCPGPRPPYPVILMPVHVRRTLLGVVGLNCVKQERARLNQDDEQMLGLTISQILAVLEQRNYIARTEQLAGLGELISEIAHDLRHPMTAIRGASRMLNDGWRQEDKRERCLHEIRANLGRMESLVSELVTFYNPKEMNIVAMDLNGLLCKALDVSASVIAAQQIQVERQLEPAAPPILGLTRNLVEAFVNLIINACQAMASGGRLTVGVTSSLDENHRGRLRARDLTPGNFMMAWVADTGCGIAPEHRDRIFRRFFTTKADGIGLGLSAVQRLVRKNLGHIDFDTVVGQGTTFFVYLPKA
jgi:signal transduction histidine kinase/FixJ family two-component response regulator